MAAHEREPHGHRLAIVNGENESRRPLALAEPPALSSAPDALALFKSLRRRWFLAGLLGVVAAALTAGAAWKLLPPKFGAFALLQVSSRSHHFARPETRNDHDMLMKTSADLIKSREVVTRALNQDGVRGLATIRKHPDTLATLAWIEESLKVEYRNGSELLNISLIGEDPADLVVLVNAITKSFLSIINNQEQSQRKERLKRLEFQHETAKEKLTEKLTAKEALMQGQAGKDQVSILTKQFQDKQKIDHYQKLLQDHQYVLDQKKAKLEVWQKIKEGLANLPVPEVPLKDLADADPQIKQDVARMMKLDERIRYFRGQGVRADDAFVRGFQAEYDELKARVDSRTQELRAELPGKFRQSKESDVEAAILELKTEIGPLEKHLAKYQEKIDELSKESEAVKEWTAKQMQVETEIQQHQGAVDQLFKQVELARIEEAAEPRIAPIGDAEWQSKDSKKRVLMIFLAPLAAFASVLMAVAWWEFTARRIHDPEEVVSGLALRVVGAVPELPDPRRRSSSAEVDELYRHNLVESIDAIRTTLLRNAHLENQRTIMVTSAVGGEGKTTLASNLAMSLARAGRKTLLIDCDLRRPAAHQLFEQTLQPGFSEVVLQEVELPDAVRPTTTDPNLYLLPAGCWDREVIQELAKTGITSVFERLREEFDFIIVDSHPVLPATDSLLIGQHVDAVILSLMRDVSQVHHVHDACRQLSTLGIRVFGAVVNGVPLKVYGKGYQYTAQPAAAA